MEIEISAKEIKKISDWCDVSFSEIIEMLKKIVSNNYPNKDDNARMVATKLNNYAEKMCLEGKVSMGQRHNIFKTDDDIRKEERKKVINEVDDIIWQHTFSYREVGTDVRKLRNKILFLIGKKLKN